MKLLIPQRKLRNFYNFNKKKFVSRGLFLIKNSSENKNGFTILTEIQFASRGRQRVIALEKQFLETAGNNGVSFEIHNKLSDKRGVSVLNLATVILNTRF